MAEIFGGGVRNVPHPEEGKEAVVSARRGSVHAGCAHDCGMLDDWRGMHRQLCFARTEIARAIEILEQANVALPETAT